MSEQEKCPKCGAKMGLGRAWISDIEWGAEPYECGVEEAINIDGMTVDACIHVLVCPTCAHVGFAWNDNATEEPASLVAALAVETAARKEAEKERDEARRRLCDALHDGDFHCPVCVYCSDESVDADCTHPDGEQDPSCPFSVACDGFVERDWG